MKNVPVFAVILLCCAALFVAPAHAQVISNPGFETGTLSPWTVGSNFCSAPDTCVPWSVTSAQANSGMFSAVDTGNIELTQIFGAVDTDSITDISFFVLHPLAQSSPVPIAVILGYSDNTSTTVNLSTNNTSWDQLDVTSDLVPGEMLDSISVFGYAPNLAIILSGEGSQALTYVDDFSITQTPEPASLMLLGSGLLGMAGLIRRFRS